VTLRHYWAHVSIVDVERDALCAGLCDVRSEGWEALVAPRSAMRAAAAIARLAVYDAL
jgi:hypothetical protein